MAIFRDALVSETVTHFSMGDRLRILFGKPVHLRIKTSTENVIGATYAAAVSYVPKFFQRNTGGYAETALQEPDK